MYVRRKSNWYIYFIAFVITVAFVIVAIFAFKWYLFPSDTQSTGIDKVTGELTDDFKPTAEHSFNLLGMVSEGATDNPELFYLAEYNAPENRLTFVMLPNGLSVGSEGRTLPNVYAAQGGMEVIKVVEKEVGITCSVFVKMDRQSFEDLLTSFGNVEYDFTKTIVVREGDDITTFNSGRHLLTSDEIYQLIVTATYEEGESYRFKLAGEIFSELINQNYHNVGTTLLDTYYDMILKNSETNLTEPVYRFHKAALLNTIRYGVSPAEFYIPYGDYTDDGGFVISENSITTIRQKAGLS